MKPAAAIVICAHNDEEYIERIFHLALFLESKGFGYRGKRTFYIMPEFKTADYLLSFFLILILAAAIYLKIKGYGRIEGLNI